MKPYQGETYTYEHALERYQLALAEAVVKRSKTSERAYICLKYAWLVRGYAEDLKGRENPDEKQLAELAAQERELLQNAYKGFTEARQTEMFPLCGMEESTVDYLLAYMSFHFKKFDISAKFLSSVITSPSASRRAKDMALELRNEIRAILTKQKKP